MSCVTITHTHTHTHKHTNTHTHTHTHPHTHTHTHTQTEWGQNKLMYFGAKPNRDISYWLDELRHRKFFLRAYVT